MSEDDDLDEVSNSVIDLIDRRRFDDALAVCDDLERRYPEVYDHLERRGLVYEAMGDHRKAAEYYRKSLAFIERDPTGFDDALIDDLRMRAERLDPSSKAPTP